MDGKTAFDDLHRLLKDFVAAYPARQGVENRWRPPLLAAARADERFDCLPQIASDEHLRPSDLLPGARTVLVFFVPFVPGVLADNAPGKFPSRGWGLAYEATNALINAASEAIRSRLGSLGRRAALTPATHNFDEVKLMARWSHKHLAHLAGLGRLGVNCQLITPAGCGGRLGSLVTDAELGDHPLIRQGELCRHKAGEECLQCLKRCPVGALALDGIDRRRCYARLRLNLAETEALKGLQPSTHVCGKCVVNLPCSMDPATPAVKGSPFRAAALAAGTSFPGGMMETS